MPLTDALTGLQNETAVQMALDRAKEIAESSKNGRKTGGEMGKNDFLLLLSAQLRYQDPLEPQSDADFSAQLAQFSSLEQMQNMNATLSSMSFYQSYSLIGKYVMAEAEIDGKFEQIAGVVDSIFSQDGVTFAQIGEYMVPVTSVSEVFNTDNMLTSDMFMQTSSHLIGRTVIANLDDGTEIEGVVTRVLVDQGRIYAQIDDGTDEPKFVLVNQIVDIRETGTERYTPDSSGGRPATPPDAMNFRADPNGSGFIEYNEDFTEAIGRWDWDEILREWVYTAYADNNNTPPGGDDGENGDDVGIGDGNDGGDSDVGIGDGNDVGIGDDGNAVTDGGGDGSNIIGGNDNDGDDSSSDIGGDGDDSDIDEILHDEAA